MAIERIEPEKLRGKVDEEKGVTGWRGYLVRWATKMPASLKELVWKVFVASAATTASLVALFIWQNPDAVVGVPVASQSVTERWARQPEVRTLIAGLLQEFYERHNITLLGLFSWSELHQSEGLWVRPGSRYPNLVGPHPLPSEMRGVAGSLIFGECDSVDIVRYPGSKAYVCPIYTSTDVWGYVVAGGKNLTPEQGRWLLVDLNVLARRITSILY